MKLPLSWLNDYMDFSGIDHPTYMHRMTMTGSIVEGIDNPAAEFKNVVVGKIVKIDSHPNADKLVVCQVDVGEGEPIQIVTGAKNVFEGAVVPVAKHKSTLPGGVKITKGKLRGVESFGMMCSTDELGISEERATGILILPDDTPIGADITEVLGLDESVADFEITSNRPDCMSIIGLARETAATFDLAFHLPEITVPENDERVEDYAAIDIQDPALCARFCGRVVKNVKIGPSPEWMQRRLKACGIRAINNVVDITNYIMLEYGQPMHAYDLDHVEGHTIIVRSAKDGEQLETLDDQPRELNSSMIAISDTKRAIGVAGVMGGANSEVTDATTTVFFEAATFDAVKVRRGAKALGMRTDASALFEKGLDPENCLTAVNRACQLLADMGGEVVGGVLDLYPRRQPPRTLPLEADKINAFLGTEIAEDEMVRILKKLAFRVDGKQITVPSFRADVVSMADVSEEVARIYGYDRIPATMMKGAVMAGGKNNIQRLEDRVRRLLTAQGLYECMTYSFIDPKDARMAGVPADADMVRISNPLGEENSVMRTELLSSMLKTLRTNLNRRNPQAALFELGKVYLPTEAGKLPDEKKRIAVGMYGDADFYRLKGVIEVLLEQTGVTGVSFVPEGQLAAYHPGRCARILAGGEELGVLGQVHPSVAAAFKLNAEIYAAELDFYTLFEKSNPERQYTALPKFPATSRDIALVVDKAVPVGEITKIFDKQRANIMESYTLFDVYEGEQVGEGKKSVAYNIVFRSADHTLTDEEVNAVMDQILYDLKATLQAELR